MRFIAILIVLFLATGCFKKIEEPSPSQDINITELPDYGATATRIIADATSTAIGFLDAGCTPQDSTKWNVHLSILASGQIDESDSRAQNQTYRNNWLCNGQLALDHLEYEITAFYEGDEEEIDFTATLGDILLWLDDYPPDDLPEIEPLVLIRFYEKNSMDFETEFRWEFSYTEAITAYESDLRGAALAEALGIEAP